jgi:hypothetical protein
MATRTLRAVVEWGHPAPQSQVGAGVVADHGARARDQLDVLLVEPDAVTEGQARAGHAELDEMLEGGAARATAGVLLLVGGLDEMHVQPDLVPG